jgi:hypothetical protein
VTPRLPLTKFLALPCEDRWFLVQAAAVQPAIRLVLRLAGFKRHGRLQRLAGAPSRCVIEGKSPSPRRAGQLLRSAALHGWLDRNCLVHSLTLRWLLERRGVCAEVRIGVRREGNRLEAHAWVEHAGMAVGDEERISRRFEPLAKLTAAGWQALGS